MITDQDLVRAAKATYADNPATFVGLKGTANVFRTVIGDVAVYAIEGTHDDQGWLLDAMALPLPSQLVGDTPDHILKAIKFMALPDAAHAAVEHPDIGFVHGGILAVLMSVWPDMLESIRNDIKEGLQIAITGHSLGAGCAVLAVGMLVAIGIMPVRSAFYAPPRVGFKKLHQLVDQASTIALRNGNDPVPEVPFRVLPFWLYLQRQLAIGGDQQLPPWSAHHIDFYVSLQAALIAAKANGVGA